MTGPGVVGPLLARFVASLHDAGPLAAEPIRLGRPEWFEETVRRYVDPDRGVPGVGPYFEDKRIWCEIRARIPAGTVAIALAEGVEELLWWRGSKSWSEEFGLAVSADPRAVLQPFVLGFGLGAPSSWKVRGRWTRRTGCPEHVRELLPPAGDAGSVVPATTGTVVPLVRSEVPEPRAVALLFLAKTDSRFRRVGLWGPRRDLLDRLPAGLAHALDRGRAGALRAGDWST